jgi:lysophospholipase L1-like esterase
MSTFSQSNDALAYHIVTIGDSTIDNLIWMDKNQLTNQFPIEDCVIGQLRKQLSKTNSSVSNLAADGFTSSNVLHGAMPMLSREAWFRAGQPFPSDKRSDGVLSPLDELERLHETKPVTHVVLSVGGNDVRVILSSMHKLPQVVSTFHANYQKICQRILSMGSIKLILMLQYQVCLTHEHGGYGVYAAMETIPGPGTGQEKLQMLMQRIYRPIITMAKEYGLAVIDLPRTFDPADETLYRLQIEPSKEGGILIAKVVSNAICTHNFDGPSYLYSMESSGETYRKEENVFDQSNKWCIVRCNGNSSKQEENSLLSEEKCNNELKTRGDHVEALPHAVLQLMNMGFEENKVKKALSENGNLPQQALEALLSDGVEVVDDNDDDDDDISEIYM